MNNHVENMFHVDEEEFNKLNDELKNKRSLMEEYNKNYSNSPIRNSSQIETELNRCLKLQKEKDDKIRQLELQMKDIQKQIDQTNQEKYQVTGQLLQNCQELMFNNTQYMRFCEFQDWFTPENN